MAQARSIRLINPNSSVEATERMAGAARRTLGPDWRVAATTTEGAPPIIVEATGLATATELVLAAFENGLDPFDGVLLSAFADPGLPRLRERLTVPVVGLVEASVREAASYGRFAVLSPTPALDDAIRGLVRQYGVADALAGVVAMPTSYDALRSGDETLVATVREAVETLVRDTAVTAVVVGGGPLVDVAAAVARTVSCTVVEPVPAAARALARQIG